MTTRRDWIATRGSALHGVLTVPGDKSVSHRAIMLAALADGRSRIEGFLEGEDTRATAAIFQQLGVRIETPVDGVRIVDGVGIDGLQEPKQPLDCGNAGTGMRLLAGVLAGQRFESRLTGDASLARRPMARVIEPLTRMGARIDAAPGSLPPLTIHASAVLQGITFAAPVASAQVKSAILLAGLRATGTTLVTEPRPTRDYTERMLATFGYPIEFGPGVARLQGGHRLRATDVSVPADFSSAAFFIIAATLVPDSDLVLKHVGLNPRRTGLLEVLRAMGANIEQGPSNTQSGEVVTDLRVRYAPLSGIEVAQEHVADMIDEFPALFVAAACARGTTRIRGAAELRGKESDRIATMAHGLRVLGIDVEEHEDGATIHGGAIQDGQVDSHGDHRIAMAFAIAAQHGAGPVRITDIANVATSFPSFDALARSVGFGINPVPN